MVEVSSTTKRTRRWQAPLERNIIFSSQDANSKTGPSVDSSTTASFPTGANRQHVGSLRQCLWKLLVGRMNVLSGSFFALVRRATIVLCFVSVYLAVNHRLGEIGMRYDLGRDPRQYSENNPASSKTGGFSRVDERQQVPMAKATSTLSTWNRTLAHYLGIMSPTDAGVTDTIKVSNSNLDLGEARKGREHILSILEDAGIDDYDTKSVLRLPSWSSISELYYTKKVENHNLYNNTVEAGDGDAGIDNHKNHLSNVLNREYRDSPIIIGLEGCAKFRENVAPKDRFLGVAGNFNSGTTAFGISLQKNCRFAEHPSSKDFVIHKRRNVFASNVNGMLSQVPWAKHKMAEYRQSNYTIIPPSFDSIDHGNVLPIVLVRDPFYWMQSMCKQGYGVRWDHSNHHCPNLIPNEHDMKRFPKLADKNRSSPVPVWMGANPIVGPTWPSMIHFWNAWYGSYYRNVEPFRDNVASHDASKSEQDKSSFWPRLIIRFEDTLYFPKQVMAEVCHCGGGMLLSEPSLSTGKQRHDYNIEEAKPDHKHEGKNNFVTAMIEYGTNATRLRNMTDEDVRFAIESLDPILMEAFGYSYPNANARPKYNK